MVNPHKNKTAARRSSKRRRGGGLRRKTRNPILRFFSRLPRWVLWVSGAFIAAVWIWFILPIVLGYLERRGFWADEPDGYPVRGIDISHYQNKIDWDQLRKDKLNGKAISFVIVKSTEGASLADPFFDHYFLKARQYAFVRGAYHFYVPGIDAVRQAKFYIAHTPLSAGDLPPILDIEKMGNMSAEQLRSDLLVWLDIVEKAYGAPPIIYSNYSFKINYLNTPEFDRYPLWIAHYYKKELTYKGDWMFWQYTDNGSLKGIKGDVDCNVYNGTLKELLQNTLH